ncbi:MAG: sensor histidine kinase [Spirochaetaceae bacterium]|nr:sensor histidine kinase [Spirochaetaceae bacterium]MDT8297052.1 sensor histidine kinase [Spirochaetaceae bacterium]
MFAVISGMMMTAILVIGVLVFSMNTRIIRNRIGSRNRTILMIVQEYISYTINDVTRDLEMLLHVIDESSRSLSSEYIRNFLNRHELVVGIHVLDTEGRIRYSLPDQPSLDGNDISGMEYYRQWQRSGGIVFHGQELTMLSAEPYSSIISSYGDTVLAAHLDFRPVGERIQQLVGMDELVVSLHDESGIYIIHPDSDYVLNRARIPYAELLEERYSGGILDTQIVDDGTSIHAQVTKMPQLHWYLGVYENESDMSRETARSLTILIPWLLPIILLSLAGSFLVSRMTTNPYRKLFHQLQQSGPDTVNFRFMTTGYLEPDSLVGAMNGVLRSLEEQAEDLIRTRNEARSANRAKDQFLANMSHELLTPLNGVLGIASLIRETHPGQETLNLLNLQKTAADELHGMIRNILEFSRVGEGSLILEKRPFRIVPVMEDCIARHVDAAADKGLLLESRIKIDPSETMIGDPARISQVLGQFIGNALKYTERGSIQVTAEFEKDDCPENHLALIVRDTGMGMNQDLIDHIESGFTQGEDVYVKSSRGVGIGLFLCRAFIELMGGEMSIESEVGTGTSILVCIPRH